MTCGADAKYILQYGVVGTGATAAAEPVAAPFSNRTST